ncbi:MAG: hypothetical protein L0Y56_08465 [Nitrospira sp.]|nr:hypothetical protein [Nitrospira sp.]
MTENYNELPLEVQKISGPKLLEVAETNGLLRKQVGYGGKVNKIGALKRIGDFFGNRTMYENPLAVNLVDLVPWVFYDAFQVAAATAVPPLTQMFTVQAGTAGRTRSDTNMTNAGFFPAPNWFNMQGFAYIPASDILQVDLRNFMEQTFFDFWIHEKVYVSGKPHYYPSPGGMFGQNNAAAASHFTIGLPIANSYFDVRLPRGLSLGTIRDDANGGAREVIADGIMGQTINSGQNFHNDVFAQPVWTTGAVAVRIYACMIGILSRGVQ